ncbi:hypothetical protein GCM10010405_09380 [Streptomyces macrosporus]|uniref:Uncharacterized protein n=1 Tax=Streptomyces macrosporus TaxID=44032 RepID=A0ABP5WMT9_9ACTN
MLPGEHGPASSVVDHAGPGAYRVPRGIPWSAAGSGPAVAGPLPAAVGMRWTDRRSDRRDGAGRACRTTAATAPIDGLASAPGGQGA